uniref:ATP synthase complex subunit 8 n=1 Tax=Stylosomus ilicicola TaxID=1425628 RepID=A0A3G1GRE3_9CUCU|nr:ATP synthase F0 subunit 8 [Stylosomus ilicicola]
MPQMAPLNWLLLFFMFILSLLMFMSMIFYNTSYCPNKNWKSKDKKAFHNWSW